MMVHTGQTAHWIRYLNEDFILILFSSSPITNKPASSHMQSYSLMHVTSVVCSVLCVNACLCALQTMGTAVTSVRFPASERRSRCRIQPHTPPLHTNLLYFCGNTFAIFNTLLYLCTITDSDGMFPECLQCLWCAKQTQTQVWFQ